MALRLIRTAIGAGFAFAALLAGLFAMITVAQWGLLGGDLGEEMVETVLTGAAPVGFLMGIAFSILAAISGRNVPLRDLSRRHVAVVGAVVGVITFLFLWGGSYSSVWDDLFNGALFALLGAGLAVVALVLARMAGPGPESDAQLRDQSGERAGL